MADTGVYYIATGEHFVREAEMSAKSVRSAMPEMPIAIATDVEPTFDFDRVIEISDPEHGFVDQIHNLHRSPFDRTLHLDTDIYVGADVSDLFDLLTQFDIAVSHNHDREAYAVPDVPDSFPEYNTGVVAYQNTAAFRDFTQAWAENYTKLATENNTQNQPSFRKTLYESELRVATLPVEYNCMARYPGHIKKDVKIAHSRMLDIQTPGANKSVDVVRAFHTLNSYKGHRLYVPDEDGGVDVIHGRLRRDAPVNKKMINSVRMDGFIHTIKEGIPFLLKRLRKVID